jgi:uncharacterized membrane protein YbhN (UPF0104 family)
MQAENSITGGKPELPSRRAPRWAGLRLGLAAVSLAACVAVALAYRQSVADAIVGMADLRPWALVILPLFFAWNLAASVGWGALLRATSPGAAPTALRLSLMRIQSQAINLVVPLGGMGGDVARSAMLAQQGASWSAGATSVVLDSMSSVVAGLLFSVVGIAFHYAALPGGASSLVALCALAGLLGVLLYAAPMLAARAARVEAIGSRAGAVLRTLADAPAALRSATRRSIGWHLLERMLMAAEIWLITWGLGTSLTLSQVLFASAVMTAFTIVLFFIPGQLGAAEGGLSLAFLALGLPPALGLSAALVRRARMLLVMCAGLIILGTSQGHAALRVRAALASRRG